MIIVENYAKWTITDKEKEKYIDALSKELIMLRNKAEVSQEELSYLIGVSRQAQSREKTARCLGVHTLHS